jgi:transcriptional regulator with XRE-family HTH domain
VANERRTTGDPTNSRKLAGSRSRAGSSRRSSRERDLLVAAQVSVGNFLRATREAMNLTQAQLADMTRGGAWQVSRAAVSAIERGQNFPGLEAMLALSNVLHIDPKELIERARLTAVPIDVTGLADEDLERQAEQYFWAGNFKQALAIYEAMLEKLALEAPERREEVVRKTATLEVRRATALKRAGALLSAIASAERAISLAAGLPQTQAEAYIVLAGLQCERGHLPLAGDAALRAIELSRGARPKTRAFAWMAQGRVLYESKKFEEARQTFLEARSHAEAASDDKHLTHIEGNVGTCWLALGDLGEARRWLERAAERARDQKQPPLEASWLVELGKIAESERRWDDAERLARAALRIARPRDLALTVFRAEWLRHRLLVRERPNAADRQRLELLRQLFERLEEHQGIAEIREFKDTVLRGGMK